MQHSQFLRSYVMTADTGFAPSVDRDGRYLTLCTCKGYHIRSVANENDWIMGTVGTKLASLHDENNFESVVYLAKITEPPMSFRKYWEDDRFLNRCDRVYSPREDGGGYMSVQWNPHLNNNNLEPDDTKPDRVLISDYFYYFGRDPIRLSSRFRRFVARGRVTRKFPIESIRELLDDFERNCSGLRNKCRPPSDPNPRCPEGTLCSD
ncbi:MAG TPA: hypothetical protein VNE86_02150 [Nitrososphaerales archaeon]|nr:hypothetical protein [Nitrososphaerales archaeon]